MCDDGWNIKNAEVACRMMGYVGAVSALSYITVQDSVFIQDNVNCQGHERSLKDCPYVAEDNCGFHEGAGVICSDLRLNEGALT